jgi:hypothetical protein
LKKKIQANGCESFTRSKSFYSQRELPSEASKAGRRAKPKHNTTFLSFLEAEPENSENISVKKSLKIGESNSKSQRKMYQI